MDGIPYTVEVLDKLRSNAHLGKHKHFAAGSRHRRHHVLCGLPSVLINVFLGSVLFAYVGDDVVPQWAKWSGAALSLVAAALGGVQTYFNFEKQFVEHRAVANEYLVIARECERLLALHFDGLMPLEVLSKQIERVNVLYSQVNTRAESLSVSKRDFKTAREVQDGKKASETSLLQRYARSMSKISAPLPQ